MSRVRSSSERWLVRCPEWTAGPFRSEAAAVAAAEGIDKLGACRGPHTVERESPEPAAEPVPS